MHLLSTNQFKNKEELEIIFQEADLIRGVKPLFCYNDKILGIVKDDPSTRTRVSFEVAMKKLGGEVVNLDLDAKSSISKGETVQDTIRVMSEYVDAIVMRYSRKEMIDECTKYSKVPIINAGNGSDEHPTQALLDLYTIRRTTGGIDGRRIMFAGDLKHSRTVHSLLNLLKLYNEVEIYYAPVKGLELNEDDKEYTEVIREKGKSVDVLYMTRVQSERHGLNVEYSLDPDCLSSHCQVMHPLPRNGEIPLSFDNDDRAIYFKEQVKNGLYIRMVLLARVFEGNWGKSLFETNRYFRGKSCM